jgi:hypothetical protein
MNINFYNDLSYIQIVSLYIFGGILVMYSMLLLLKNFWPTLIVEEVDSDFISGLHAALFTITFLTLGYCITNVTESVDKYQQNVSVEANEIRTLDNLISVYQSQEVNSVRRALYNYSNSIVIDEWPLLSSRVGSSVTARFYGEMQNILSKLNPSDAKQLVIYSEMLRTLNKIDQSRTSRIDASKVGLSHHFILMNNIGYMSVLLISALMLTRFTWFRFIALNTQLIAVAFIFATTIILDNPFRGSDRISPEPIEAVTTAIRQNNF